MNEIGKLDYEGSLRNEHILHYRRFYRIQKSSSSTSFEVKTRQGCGKNTGPSIFYNILLLFFNRLSIQKNEEVSSMMETKKILLTACDNLREAVGRKGILLKVLESFSLDEVRPIFYGV